MHDRWSIITAFPHCSKRAAERESPQIGPELCSRAPRLRSYSQSMAQLAAWLAHPLVAYVLLLAALYALTFACFNPAERAVAAAGAAALVLALPAMHTLGASYGALALLAAGALLLAAEMHVPFAGVLGATGFAAFLLGSALLFDADRSGLPRALFAVLGALAALGQLRVVHCAMRRAHPPGE